MKRIVAILAAGVLPLFGQTPVPTPSYAPLTEDAKLIASVAMKAFEKGDLVAARLQFEKMRALSPGHPMPLINLGTIAFQSGKLSQSAELLEQATRVDPNAAEAWNLLGMVRVYQDQPDQALAALSQAVLLNPDNPKVHNYLGVAIGRKRWFDGAEAELQQAIRLDPKYADAHFNLALIFLQRDPSNKALAEKHYQTAIKLGAPADLEVEKKLKNEP
ncbi:MAG TPA: tetratricopeptide repeat protein [Chthoniobacterales bacterium]|jgi:Flp pilus assembly protein TadD